MSSKPELAQDLRQEAERVIAYHDARETKAFKALRFLRHLAESEIQGKFVTHGFETTDAQIVLEFYLSWAKRRLTSPFHDRAVNNQLCYDDIEPAADKLRKRVRNLLRQYYEGGASQTRARLDIIDGKDRFRPYFKDVSLSKHSSDPAPSRALQPIAQRSGQEKGSLTITPVWKSDRVHELIRTVVPGSQLRLQITGFVDVRVMRTSIKCALDREAKVLILQTDPGSPIFEARFRLRPDMSVSEFRDDILQQHRILQRLSDQKTAGSLEHRFCDLMPFGYFVQGESENHGPWMFIGLLPALSSYSDGPMIELHPGQRALWDLFERTWHASWANPRRDATV